MALPDPELLGGLTASVPPLHKQASFNATRGVLTAMHQYSQWHRGMVGLVADLGWFDREEVARALSKKRSYALTTVVVQNEEVREGTKGEALPANATATGPL
jgi:hypothetical protein